MKKRLISFLILVVLLVSLLPASAFAAPAVTIVTLSTGENIATLCQRYGVDYNTYRGVIMALNCVSNENDFALMPPGTQVVIPVNAACAAAISAAGTVGAAAPGAGAVNGNAAAAAGSKLPGIVTNNAGLASKVVPGDTVSCYVIAYTIQAGDTIINLYSSRGMSYKTFSSAILSLNNISGFNNLKVGQTLLLPVTVLQQNDQVVYTVMAHRMKAGETVFNIISSGYGMNFKASQDLLKAANGKDDLGKFKVGEILLIPVQGYVANTTAGVS